MTEQESADVSPRTRRLSMACVTYVSYLLSSGIQNAFGVFYVTLLETFRWSPAALGGVNSLRYLVQAVASPVVGHLLDRYGPRRVVGGGCILLTTALLLLSQISSLWQFYLVFGVLAAASFSCMGRVPTVVLISGWFPSRRGTAIGAINSATGVGIVLVVPLAQWLVTEWGWGTGLQILAGSGAVLVLPLIWLFYGSDGGDGASRATSRVNSKGDVDWTAGLAFRSTRFWLIFVSRITAVSGTTVIVTYQIAHVVDVGFGPLFAATIFGLMGLTSTGGRMFFGFIADISSRRSAYTINTLTSLVGIGALIATRNPSDGTLLYIYVALFGIGLGSRAVISSALSADIFSGNKFGSVFGYLSAGTAVGGALGSWQGGVLYGVTGSYVSSFWIAAVTLGLSDVCIRIASSTWASSRDERLLRNEDEAWRR
ncbi:MAG: MFS transporter [Deltaproteobacteria bacterium]|nr:MFS transporter [Deltaproteobacteria bacterium]